MGYWSNFYKPCGLLGYAILMRMNVHHRKKQKWFLSFINLTEAHSLIDIGCGGGALLKDILDTNKHIFAYGLDHSPISVELASKINKRYINRRCNIIEGNVSKIPLLDNSVDLITAFSVVYYWDDLYAAFQELYRILSPNGTILIDCTLCNYSGSDVSIKYKEKIPQLDIYSIDQIKTIMQSIGFDDVQIFKEKHPLRMCVVSKKL